MLPEESAADCGNGAHVTYLFMVGDEAEMELDPLWNDYFRSCEPGSYSVLVHAQNAAFESSIEGATLVDDPVVRIQPTSMLPIAKHAHIVDVDQHTPVIMP